MLKKSYVIGLIWWCPPFYGFYRVRPFRDISLCKMALPIGQPAGGKTKEQNSLIAYLKDLLKTMQYEHFIVVMSQFHVIQPML